uniref:Uncharacterized protein n=1 Tax=Lotus japonicus TaxID=34305 RepID=I3SKP1_LOTJA|nr:unknown [Lotus japonicus]
MSGSLFNLLRIFDPVEDHVEARQRNSPNPVAPPSQESPRSSSSFNNTGTQNLRGLINNTGYTKGNGNGSVIFGGFDSTTRNHNYRQDM